MSGVTNVQFYEKVKELQDLQHESEKKRLELNQELDTYVNSDQRLAKLKAVRLQNYWKKICEDERRSQWRNEQLLRDFDRVESHMASLSARTERLRLLKKQYEDSIERMYPRWKEQVVYAQRQKQIQQQQQEQMLQQQHQQQMIPQMAPPVQLTDPSGGQQYMSAPGQPVSGSGHSQGYTQVPTGQPTVQHSTPAGYVVPHPTEQPVQYMQTPVAAGIGVSTTGPNIPQQPGVQTQQEKSHQFSRSFSMGEVVLPQEQQEQNVGPVPQGHHAPSVGSTLNTISSLHTMTGTVDQQLAGQVGGEQPPHIVQTQHHQPVRQTQSSPQTSSTVVPAQTVAPSVKEVHMSPRQQQVHPAQQTGEVPASVAPPGGILSSQPSGAVSPVPQTPRSVAGKDDDDFSDMSLPLSGRESPVKAKEDTPRSARSQGSVKSQGSARSRSPAEPPPAPVTAVETKIISHEPETEAAKPQLPQPDISTEGLFMLLKLIEDDFPAAFSPDAFYRSPMPASSVQKEILFNANKGDGLGHLDPASISMVVLDQLPLLVLDLPSGCLLSDKILLHSTHVTSEETIRPQIQSENLDLWNHLFEHLVQIVKYKIMDPAQAASTFAPHLIANDSPYEEKAKTLVTNLLQNLPPEDTLIRTSSTTTLPSSRLTSPRKVHEDKPQDVAIKTLPSLKLGMGSGPPAVDLSDEAEDDFFSQPVPKPDTSAVPLTQTAAYQQMLSGTMTTTAKAVESDTSSDDIENQLGSMVSPRRSHDGSRKASAAGSQIMSPRSEADKKDGTKSPLSAASSEKSVTSPLGSPKGYIPTGITGLGTGNTGPSTLSTLGSTGKSSKKPGFMYGDSDTDEDVEVPGGTGGTVHGMEQDDFDFYD